MALAPGGRIGPYEVRSTLGKGGMGVVFLAQDTKLQRDVALKLLPDDLAGDADRLSRFQREAQVLASLNHPNIAQIYGLEESSTARCIVMELITGETLEERLRRGAIPVDEALPLAKQIADALEAAHDKGIVHRDLKPANIKMTPDGRVKVLDFGLAKMFSEGTPLSGLSNSPTLVTAGSIVGTILGTAAYMSPEQARGKTVDKRTDIWAFGAVLFEMLTGRQAFEGETVTELLGAVMHKEPDWKSLPAEMPPGIRRVLRRCLTKDPRQRIHDIADARVELEALGQETEDDAAAAPVHRRSRRQYWWAATALLVGGVLVGAVADRSLQSARSSSAANLRTPLLRTTIDLPTDAPLAVDIPALGYNSPVLAISPDGAWLAYVAGTPSGRMLYLRDMASGEVRPLAGTDGAIHPFFSPDGQWIGFLTVDHVKKIPRQGGTVISLCEANTPVLAWWIQPDLIYFTETETYTLSRVAADGGKPEHILSAPDVKVTRFDDVLPDGETALAERNNSIGGDFGDIIQINLRSNETKVLVRSGYAARYVPPGYVMFARAGNLMAVQYDNRRGDLVGDPFTLASGVAMESLFGMLHAASSSTGISAYVPGGDLSVGKLASIDRRGAVQYFDVPERVYGVVDLAPDENRLGVQVADVNDYIWIWDFTRHEGRRVPTKVSEGWPVWSPDGRRLASASQVATRAEASILLHDIGPGGAVAAGSILESKGRFASSWSPMGDVLALTLFPTFRTEFLGVGKTVNAAGFEGVFSTFSPDGRWLAYESTQTGANEVFIRSFPEGKIAGQISNGGSVEPRWKPSGDLYYRNGHRWFSTRVSTNPELRWDPPRLVFDTEFIDTPGMSYDVSRDGQHLLVVKRARPISSSKINLIVNWFDALPH